MTMSKYDNDLVLVFIEEGQNLAEEIEGYLLSLDKGFSVEIVSNILHSLHSFKGGCKIAENEDLILVLQEFEEYVQELKDGTAQIGEDSLKQCIELMDCIFNYLTRLKDDGDHKMDLKPPMAILEKLLKIETAQNSNQDSKVVPIDESDSHWTETDFSVDSLTTNKILFVDDDEAILNLLVDEVSEHGYEVYAASSGNQAWEVFKDNKPDIVVSDYKMPDGDGLELAKRIIEQDPTVPITIQSGLSDRDTVIGFLNSGVFSFLEKPTDDIQFKYCIQRSFEEARRRKVLAEIIKLNFRSFIRHQKLISHPQVSQIESLAQELEALDGLQQQQRILTESLLKAPKWEDTDQLQRRSS